MEKEYINPNNPVYISYAWADDEHLNIEEVVDKLCKILDDNNIKCKRDKENLCDYRSNIQESEEEIGAGAAIIVVISERYLKSLHCMNEWHLLRENGKIWERVFPIVLEDANISNDEIYEKYYQFFDERRNRIINKQRKGYPPLKRAELEAIQAGFYIEDLKEMYRYLTDYNTSKLLELRKDNYEAIIGQLMGFWITYTPINTKEVKNNIENDRLSFKQDAPIYISYAHAEQGREKIAVVVDFIRDVFEKESIRYRIDEDIEGGEHITDFEREIGNSKYTIIVYNEKYFRSPHCMYEFKQIKNTTKNKKIICINSDNINLERYEKIQELYNFWLSIESDIEFKNPKYLTQIENETLANKYYKEEIKELRDYFGEKKHYNINEDNKLTKQDTEHLINTVKKWFPKNSES